MDPARLNGCGLLVVNPPYRFEQQVPAILTALLDRLGDREPGEAATVRRIVDE
jgi:23S rRNA (adenine2030-N6)-methyltransferase